MMECLKDLIGITRTVCPCTTGALTPEEKTDLEKSNSGLYMDEHVKGFIDLRAIKGLDNCKAFFAMVTTSRNSAARVTRDDLVQAMNVRYKSNKEAFMGEVGERSFATSAAITKRYQAMVLKPNGYTDAVIKVNRLELYVNQIRSIHVHISKYREGSDITENIYTFPVTTVANSASAVDIGNSPLILPLKEDGYKINYVVWYDTTEDGGGFLPKDNKLDCNCTQGLNKLHSFLTPFGYEADNIGSIMTYNQDSISHGIMVSVDVRCDNDLLFCNEYREDDAIAVALAYAVMFQTAMFLIEEIRKSSEVNRYTMMSVDQLRDKKANFNKEYNTRIVYLSHVIDVSASDCFICRPKGGEPYIGGILS